MALKVFISYRRDDSAGHAGRVYDRLKREFGLDRLVMDVDTIPLGTNFVKVIDDEVVKCDVLLAIIGPGWLDARDEDGKRRLENPNDVVRIEIATALKHVHVIPILIEGTRIPKADQLPDDLKELSVRNALNVRHVSFVDDMERLIRGLKRAPKGEVRRWFLSYHSPDQPLAERLKAALERKDADTRVFFTPSSLRAEGFWTNALAEEIAQADAFILLVGERGIGDWQKLEYYEAIDKLARFPDFPVILVLLEGQTTPGLPCLRHVHWIITPDPSSEEDVARLFYAASGSGAWTDELWRYTQPYCGLAAMAEEDGTCFFGRDEKTVEVLKALAAAPGELLILLGNSGVGKSSLAQAGVLSALKRQAWPEGANTPPQWPRAFWESRRWCFLTLRPGTEPLKALVGTFLATWQFGSTDPERAKQEKGWIELLSDGKATLRDLLDVTERRYRELDQTKPAAFLLYVDQGEELYLRAEERQRRRFSEVIAQAVADPRLYILMSMRTDFLDELQKDELLYKVHRKVDVPLLREAELREVVTRPAELFSARFETAELADIITRRTAEDSVKEVGALPLLSYTLDDMWTQMVKRNDGVLRLPAQSFELGGVLVNRADDFVAAHPNAEDQLRRIFTLKLATVREGEEPTRRRALRSEFTDEEWRLVNELAGHPYRLLITATPEGGGTYAAVAHEAIFRRWDRLHRWIAAEREFLAWKAGLEAARRIWQAMPDSSKGEALLMGLSLRQARSWISKCSDDITDVDRDFIVLSSRRGRWRFY